MADGILGKDKLYDDSNGNFGDMFNNFMPKKMKKRKVTVAQARKILAQQEAEKLVDFDDIDVFFLGSGAKISSSLSSANCSACCCTSWKKYSRREQRWKP